MPNSPNIDPAGTSTVRPTESSGQGVVPAALIPSAVRVFTESCAILLLITALAKLYSATGGSKILEFLDPVLLIKHRTLMVMSGLAELVAAAYLLAGGGFRPKLLLIATLGVNFVLYRLGSWMIGAAVCPCFGTLTDKLGVTPDGVNFALRLVIGYFAAGSVLLLAISRSAPSGQHAPLTQTPTPGRAG